MKKKSDSQKSDDKLKTAELRKRVGNRVAAIRRGKGMTQQDLADASGMSRGHDRSDREWSFPGRVSSAWSIWPRP